MTNPVVLAQLAEAAIDTIDKLAGAGACAAIRAVISTLRAGFAGDLAPQEVLTQIENLQNQVDSNDAAALAELKKRFP